MRASSTLPTAAATNNTTSSVALDALSQSGSLPFTDAEVNRLLRLTARLAGRLPR
jgi:hypothetical protein